MQNNRGQKSNDKSSFKKGKSTTPKGGFKTPSKSTKPKPVVAAAPKDTTKIRLNKYIANAGICARREADIYIQSGNVKVNGKVVTEMGSVININDEVYFDGVLIAPGKKEYILLNKPKNFTTATDETQTNRNVMELLGGATGGIKPVGRMDKNTTGLLLLTNDTDLLTKLSGGKQKLSKLYQVSLSNNLKYEDLEKIQAGVTVEEHKVYVEEISYIEKEPKSEVGIKVKTANIKVIRSLFEQLNYEVLRIDRVAYGGLTKKNLPRGHWRYLTNQEIINLKNS